MRGQITGPAVCALLLCGVGELFAEAQPVNVDELPHKEIQLPNGTKAQVIVYQDHNWRVVDVSVLAGNSDEDPDVCFEGKFEMVVQPNKLKLAGFAAGPGTKERPEKQWASIILDDLLKTRVLRELKRNDNLWFCGTLRRTGPRELDFVAVDVLKLPPDVVRYEQDIERKWKQGDGEALVELGHKIRRQGKVDVPDIEAFDKLSNLSDKAYDYGLTLKEKALKTDDADGLYSLAVLWRELRNKNSRFRDLVEQCLKVNPTHSQATRVAAQEWGYQEFEGKLLSKERIAEIQKQRQEERTHLAAAERAGQEARDRERRQAAQNRPALLVSHQAELRTNDAKGRERAVAALGEAAGKSLDPGFGEEAVEVLVNLPDAAVVSALEAAGRSQLGEVRRQAFEALAWRVGKEGRAALDALATALAGEKEAAVAHAGVGAVTALGAKAATGILMAGLSNSSATVQDEIMEGLRTVTKQQLSSRKEWEEWWGKNKP